MRRDPTKQWQALCLALSVAAASSFARRAAAEAGEVPEAEPEPAGILAPGTRWATEYYAIAGPQAGPTVMVTAGVHGNETAPPLAAAALLRCPIQYGKLFVVPRANRPALDRGSRHSPKSKFRDLNRNFPKSADDEPQGTMARAMWEFVESVRPNFLIDLHEGFDFRLRNHRSVGNSIIYAGAESAARAHWLVNTMNEQLELSYHRFVVLRSPARGSLARAVAERLDARAFIFETTRRDQTLPARASQHLFMLDLLFDSIGMRTTACELRDLDGPTIAAGSPDP